MNDGAEETASPPNSEDTLKTHMIINLNSNMLIMSQMVGEMAVAVKQVAEKITDVEERRRRDRVVFGACMLIVVMVGGFVLSQISSNQKQVDLNTEQLTILKTATGADAQAAAAKNTQLVVRQIDCNDKINDRELLNSVRDLAPNISVPEVPADCPAIIAALTNPTTTTTVKGKK